MAYQELNLIGMHIQGFRWRGEKLRASFGSGYSAAAVVGAPSGLHTWRIDAKTLTNTEEGLFIGSKTWFDYYYEFFIEHTTGDEEVFVILWDGRYWHARFKDTEIDFNKFVRVDFYSQGGLELEQVRVAGIVYEADGSIDPSIPCPPQDGEVLALSETVIELSWEDPPDGCFEDPNFVPCPPSNGAIEAVSDSIIQLSWEDPTGDCSDGVPGGGSSEDDDYYYYL